MGGKSRSFFSEPLSLSSIRNYLIVFTALIFCSFYLLSFRLPQVPFQQSCVNLPIQSTQNSQNLSFLISHISVPVADFKGSDARLLTLIEALQLEGHSVDIITWEDKYVMPYHRERLAKMGVGLLDLMIPRPYPHLSNEEIHSMFQMRRSEMTLLEHLLQTQKNYDVVILFLWSTPTYWTFMEHIARVFRQVSPYTRHVLLSDDVHWRVLWRNVHAKVNFGNWGFGNSDWASVKSREAESILRSDFLAAITEDDRQELQQLSPFTRSGLLRYSSSLPLEPKVVAAREQRGWSERSGIVFVGFDNFVNTKSLQWFVEHVWSKIHSVQPMTFHILGNVRCENSQNYPSLKIHGQLRDEMMHEILSQVRVFVSPIVDGTGLNTKNILALAYGLPLVTTDVGIQGMRLPMDEKEASKIVLSCLHTDPDCFARMVLQAYSDKNTWSDLHQFGVAHVIQQFNLPALQQDIRGMIKGLEMMPKQPRSTIQLYRNRIAVIVTFTPKTHPWIISRSKTLALRIPSANPNLDVKVFYPTLSEERDEIKFLKESLDLDLVDYIVWIDGSIIDYDPSIVTPLIKDNPGGISAPIILMDSAYPEAFYNQKSFLLKPSSSASSSSASSSSSSLSRRIWAWPSYVFQEKGSEGALVEMSAVDGFYIVPVEGYKIGATNHIRDRSAEGQCPICDWIRKYENKVVLNTKFRAYYVRENCLRGPKLPGKPKSLSLDSSNGTAFVFYENLVRITRSLCGTPETEFDSLITNFYSKVASFTTSFAESPSLYSFYLEYAQTIMNNNKFRELRSDLLRRDPWWVVVDMYNWMFFRLPSDEDIEEGLKHIRDDTLAQHVVKMAIEAEKAQIQPTETENCRDIYK